MNGRRRTIRHIALVASTLSWLPSQAACNARPIAVDPDGIPAEVRAYARARCQAFETCECESDTYRDRAQCEDNVISIYLEYIADDDTVDLGCFDSAARSWRGDLCDALDLDPPCNVIEPTREIGDPCSSEDVYGDPFARVPFCSGELFCWDSVCIGPVEERQEGDPCSPEGLCGSSELVCFVGRCESPHLEGEPCESSADCAGVPPADLLCTDGLCVAHKDEGEPCEGSGECLSRSCVEARCIIPPSLICLSSEF